MKLRRILRNGWRICFLFMLFTLFNHTISYASNALPEYFGDIDQDETLSLKDAQIYLEIAIGIKDFDETRSFYCDADRDGITLDDAQEILQMALGIIPAQFVEAPGYEVLYQGIHNGTDMSFALRISSEKELDYLMQNKSGVEGFENYLEYVPEDFFEDKELLFIMQQVHTGEESRVALTELLFNGTYYRAALQQNLLCKNQNGDACVCMLALDKVQSQSEINNEVAVKLQTKGVIEYEVGKNADIAAIGYLSKKAVVIQSVEELQQYVDGIREELFYNSLEDIEYFINLDGLDYEETLEEAENNAKTHVEEALAELLIYDESFFEEQALVLYHREKKSGTRYVKLNLIEEEKRLEIIEERVYLEGGEPVKSPNWLSWLIRKLMGKKTTLSDETIWRVTEIILPKEKTDGLEIVIR